MERWTVIVGGAVVVTVAAGTFAVVRAVATDAPLPPPLSVVAAPSTTIGATSSTIAVVGGGGDTAPAATTTVAAPVADAVEIEIEISGFAFSPEDITIAPGTTVTWVNRDGVDHSIISEDGSVLSPPIDDGDTFSFTFTAVGVYPYICGFHPEMSGTIVVEG